MPTFIFTDIYITTFFLVLIYIYPCSYRSSLCFYFVLFLLKDFYIWPWGPCLLVYLHTMCMLHAHSVHERVLGLLELELRRIVCHHVDVGDKILVLCKSSKCFYLLKYSFHYNFINFKIYILVYFRCVDVLYTYISVHQFIQWLDATGEHYIPRNRNLGWL